MAIDARVPGSPEWWLVRLGEKLEHDRERLDKLDRYDRGDHPLPEGNRRYSDTYRRFRRQARSNFVGLVVESLLERLHVDGFRMGGQGEATADAEAARIWQAHQLDADAGLVHRAALVMSRAYVCVAPDPDARGAPLITVEDPRQVIHESDPARRRKLKAAMKLYRDDMDGRHHAVVYLPDSWHYFVDRGKELSWEPSAWDVDGETYEGGRTDSPLPGEIPVVPFLNRPDLAGGGLGEFEDVIDIQDRINQTLLDRLVVATMQAFRQRWAKGLSLTDEQGRAQRPFDPGADMLWAVEDEAATFGDFAQSDLSPLLSAVQADIRDLAAITRTPPHYLLGEIVNASGDALKAAETGLVSKAKARQRQLGESWETVMRLAFALEGRTAAVDAETMWRDPESRSMAELADAAVKKQAVGVPWRQTMEDLQYTPAQIDRMETQRAADALNALLAQPDPAAGPGQQQTASDPAAELEAMTAQAETQAAVPAGS